MNADHTGQGINTVRNSGLLFAHIFPRFCQQIDTNFRSESWIETLRAAHFQLSLHIQ